MHALLKCYVKVTIKSILQIYLICNCFNEMINMRKNYEAPSVKVVKVEVEQGYANSRAIQVIMGNTLIGEGDGDVEIDDFQDNDEIGGWVL